MREGAREKARARSRAKPRDQREAHARSSTRTLLKFSQIRTIPRRPRRCLRGAESGIFGAMKMLRVAIALLVPIALLASACGGETPAVKSANAASGEGAASSGASGSTGSIGSSVAPSADARATSASHPCGENDKVHTHDLHAEGASEALVPCSKSGGHDYSGAIHVETIPEGVHIIIHATDDQVNMGLLGADAKKRDAGIV